MEKLLSLQDAATALGVGYSTLRSWIRAGHVPALRLGQRRVFVRESTLRRLVNTAQKAGASR